MTTSVVGKQKENELYEPKMILSQTKKYKNSAT